MRFINDITEFIFLEDEPRPADIIFIPGGSCPEIAERAADLWGQGLASYILPSGRYSMKWGHFRGPLSKAEVYNRDYRTEWEFLKDVLISNGVEEGAILREAQSTNTYENAVCSRQITDHLKLDIQKAILCSQAFHARRCSMYYQSIYPQTEFILCPSDTQGINKQNWFHTEFGIEKVMGELTKCGSQFVDIIKKYDRAQKEIYGR